MMGKSKRFSKASKPVRLVCSGKSEGNPSGLDILRNRHIELVSIKPLKESSGSKEWLHIKLGYRLTLQPTTKKDAK